jgi:hypothetical protein
VIDSFSTLIPQMFVNARPNARLLEARGRTVPVQERRKPRPEPFYHLVAPTHPEGSRAERRAAASPRLRPAPSTPESRAWLARHRAALAVLRCEAREAKRNAK